MAAFINRLDTIYPDIPEKTAIQLLRQETVYEKVILENPNGKAIKGKADKAGGGGGGVGVGRLRSRATGAGKAKAREPTLELTNDMVGRSVTDVRRELQQKHTNETPFLTVTKVPAGKAPLRYYSKDAAPSAAAAAAVVISNFSAAICSSKESSTVFNCNAWFVSNSAN